MSVSSRKLKLGLQVPYKFTEKINEFSGIIDTEGCTAETMREFVSSDFISIAGKKLICDSRGEEGKTDLNIALDFYYPDVYEMFYSVLRDPEVAEEKTASYIETINEFADWVTTIPQAKDVIERLSNITENGDPDTVLDIHLDYTLIPDDTTMVAVFDVTSSSTL